MFGLPIPGLSTLLGGAAAIAVAAAGFFYVEVLQRDKTIASMQIAAKQAQLDQDNKDAALSAQIVAAEQARLAALRQATAAIQQKVNSDAQTNTCGPAVRDATRFLQQRNGSPGNKTP